MRGAGRWRLYGPLTCMGALRSDERASANRTEALYGVGALCRPRNMYKSLRFFEQRNVCGRRDGSAGPRPSTVPPRLLTHRSFVWCARPSHAAPAAPSTAAVPTDAPSAPLVRSQSNRWRNDAPTRAAARRRGSRGRAQVRARRLVDHGRPAACAVRGQSLGMRQDWRAVLADGHGGRVPRRGARPGGLCPRGQWAVPDGVVVCERDVRPFLRRVWRHEAELRGGGAL